MFSRDCPCGSSAAYDACCGPLHRGTAHATSPEQLMRSRFAAYAVGETDYVFRTWHPRTRPDDLTPDPGLTWTRLEVLDATGEEVEFIAHFDSPAGPGSLHERSVFEQRGGRWVYVAARRTLAGTSDEVAVRTTASSDVPQDVRRSGCESSLRPGAGGPASGRRGCSLPRRRT